jgi:hypothetical protein
VFKLQVVADLAYYSGIGLKARLRPVRFAFAKSIFRSFAALSRHVAP